jgi:membrane-associated phospholipid phosphatase
MGDHMEDLSKKTAIFAVIAIIIYLILYYFCDRAIDLWIHHNYSNSWLSQGGIYVSDLAYGVFIKIGLAICFVLIIIIDPDLKKRWTRHLLYVCVTAAIAIVIGEGCKYLLGRHRPIRLFTHNAYGFQFFAAKWELNSTPSGHTLRAFAILTALSLLYRRLAVVFMALAVLIGASRVVVTAHYPSDVVFGAFIGIFTAAWTYKYFFPEA